MLGQAGALALMLGFAAAAAAETRQVTQGPAETIVENLYTCPRQVPNSRLSAVGRITAADGTRIIVPAETRFAEGPKLPDLFNLCTGVTPETLDRAAVERLPVVEIDPDGEVITGFIIADNYVEVYVNGRLVGVDAHPYTPFNSSIIRFRAKRPYTLALLLVDWEENLGLGSELNRGNRFFAGDGGVLARFSDGTVTDGSWRAQSFYIAPLARAEDVVERGAVHDTAALGRTYPEVKVPDCQDRCFAVHYPIPPGWQAPGFDDRAWPEARSFTDAEVGTTALTGYTRYPEAFAGARWIWSDNLVFDNLVLARKTVR
jgi:hypothetical protein